MTAEDLAILDLLQADYHLPPPGQPRQDQLMHEWAARYRPRLAAMQRMLAAIAVLDTDVVPGIPSRFLPRA